MQQHEQQQVPAMGALGANRPSLANSDQQPQQQEDVSELLRKTTKDNQQLKKQL